MTEVEQELRKKIAKAFYVTYINSVNVSFKRANEENTALARASFADADYILALIKEALPELAKQAGYKSPEEQLPTPKDLRGMSPDFTGDQESGEYVRSLRE